MNILMSSSFKLMQNNTVTNLSSCANHFVNSESRTQYGHMFIIFFSGWQSYISIVTHKFLFEKCEKMRRIEAGNDTPKETFY